MKKLGGETKHYCGIYGFLEFVRCCYYCAREYLGMQFGSRSIRDAIQHVDLPPLLFRQLFGLLQGGGGNIA